MCKRLCFTVLFLGLLGLCAACAHQSVKHLSRNPLSAAASQQEIKTKNINFVYTAYRNKGSIRIKGTALPTHKYIPRWAEYIQEMAVFCYLTDAKGNILGKDLHNYLPQKLDIKEGHPFSFTLSSPPRGEEKQLYVAFGYSLKLSSARSYTTRITDSPLEDDSSDIFYAREGAVLN
jgi:hypothetical protein